VFTIVRQHQAGILERLGKYRSTLDPGLTLTLPFVDKVRRIDLREQLLSMTLPSVATKDDRAVAIDLRVAYRVTDPVKATYEISSYAEGLDEVTRTSVGHVIGGLDREQVFARQTALGDGLRSVLVEATEPWGLRIDRVEVPRIDRIEDVRG
jgi:regulator of protease activity HflC (stomatin/prohibitin superfamily)